jgi:uncharacterized protein (UPF0248 family)
MNAIKPIIIDKEEVLNLRFPENEVLLDKDMVEQRRIELDRATTLGNIEHSKFKIVFEDNEGRKQVETTIWATTDKRVILKKGAVIPINRIIEIR